MTVVLACRQPGQMRQEQQAGHVRASQSALEMAALRLQQSTAGRLAGCGCTCNSLQLMVYGSSYYEA
jgi:hypothetical protein